MERGASPSQASPSQANTPLTVVGLVVRAGLTTAPIDAHLLLAVGAEEEPDAPIQDAPPATPPHYAGYPGRPAPADLPRRRVRWGGG